MHLATRSVVGLAGLWLIVGFGLLVPAKVARGQAQPGPGDATPAPSAAPGAPGSRERAGGGFDAGLRLIVSAPPRLLAGIPQSITVVLAGKRADIQLAVTVVPAGTAIGAPGTTAGTPAYSETVARAGTVMPSFTIPRALAAGGLVSVEVVATTTQGVQRVVLEVPITAAAVKTTIATDKPLYQPGQTIHVRTISIDPIATRAVAEEPLTLELKNAAGILIWRQTQTTDAYGVTDATIALAQEIPTGTYTLRAIAGDEALGQIATATLAIRRYQLPKFRVTIKTDKTAYRPDEAIAGSVTARYTFGEPVKGSQVAFEVAIFDPVSGEFRGRLGELGGKTDDTGIWKFSWRIPEGIAEYFERDTLTLSLRAVVTDPAGLVEPGYSLRTVANQPLLLSLVPESGVLVPGLDNPIYAIARYPDGSPAQAQFTFSRAGDAVRFETTPEGIARFLLPLESENDAGEFTRDAHEVRAVDRQGNRLTFTWRASTQTPPLDPAPHVRETRLTPSTALVVGGAPLTLTLTRQPGAAVPLAYLVDLVKFGHVVRTVQATAAPVGPTTIAVPLPDDLFGQIELVAHAVSAAHIRASVATTSVFRPRGDRLELMITADKPTYAPGASGLLKLLARRRSGIKGPAILGIDVVDEAVFALQDKERERLELALFLRRQSLADTLRTFLVDETLDEARRALIAGALFARSAPASEPAPTADSRTFARERTVRRLAALAQLIEKYRRYLFYRGVCVGIERRSQPVSADPFAWLAKHEKLTGYTDAMRQDAWGRRIALVRSGESDRKRWKLVAPGPDGRLNVPGDDDRFSGDDVQYHSLTWSAGHDD